MGIAPTLSSAATLALFSSLLTSASCTSSPVKSFGPVLPAAIESLHQELLSRGTTPDDLAHAGKSSALVFPEHHRRAVSRPADYGGRHPFEVMARRTSMAESRKGLGRSATRSARGRGRKPAASRRLGGVSDHEPIRFLVDTYVLKYLADHEPVYLDKVNFLLGEVLPAATKFWSEALSVFPLTGPIFVADPPCRVPTKALRNYYRDVGAADADLLIFVWASPYDGGGCDNNQTLAYAGSCQTDQYDRPTVGAVTVCLDLIDLKDEASRSRALDVMVHEYGHILGMISNNFPYFWDSTTGTPRTPRPINIGNITCIDGQERLVEMPSIDTVREGYTTSGIRHFEIVTPTVAQVARNQFDCQAMAGARLENQPTGRSCFGSHWDMRLFLSEEMAAFKLPTSQYLSPLTLAFFEDTGWYEPDYALAEISPFGHGAGCPFVFEDCIVNGEIPPYSEDVFCNATYKSSAPFGCDPLHRFKSQCDLVNYTNSPTSPFPPEPFQYFPSPELGGRLRTMDYCPIFAGNIKGTDCYDASNSKNPGSFLFESYGKSSSCFNTVDLSMPLCLETRCNEVNHTVEVMLDGTVLVCEEDGQAIDIPGLDVGQIRCPRLAVICPDLICQANCAGRGVCDYTVKNPECKCFDAEDPSPMCLNSPTVAPPPPSTHPTVWPSASPSNGPTLGPSTSPSTGPSMAPSPSPTTSPTLVPSPSPSTSPSLAPSLSPQTDKRTSSAQQLAKSSGSSRTLSAAFLCGTLTAATWFEFGWT